MIKYTKYLSVKLMLVFLSFSINSLQAQYYQRQNLFEGGLIVGANFTQVDGDAYKGYGKTGWSGGGIIYLPLENVDLPFPGTLAFSLEVLYNQKGAKAVNQFNPVYRIQSQTIDLHYGEVPIQINYFRGTRSSGAGMGLAIGYLGFAEETIDRGNGAVIKNGYPFRKLDLSYIMTFNIHLYKGIFISPRFQYSLLSIRKDAGEFGKPQQFNNILSLRCMYLFGNKSYN